MSRVALECTYRMSEIIDTQWRKNVINVLIYLKNWIKMDRINKKRFESYKNENYESIFVKV